MIVWPEGRMEFGVPVRRRREAVNRDGWGKSW